MKTYSITEYIPESRLQALTNEALAEYLSRHGWRRVNIWRHRTGADIATWELETHAFDVPVSHRFPDHAQRMATAIGFIVEMQGQHIHAVLTEIGEIGDSMSAERVVAENATSEGPA